MPFPSDGRIFSSGTYTGSFSNTNGHCIEVYANDVTITGADIGPCSGRGILVHRSDGFVLENSHIDIDAPTDLPDCPSTGFCEQWTAIYARYSSNLTIHSNTLERGESLIVLHDSDGVSIYDNTGLDPVGPFPRGQFALIQGGSNFVLIQNNTLTCDPSRGCEMEDAINLGSGSHLQVLGNYLDSGQGLGKGSGCGIVTENVSDVVIRGNQAYNQFFAPSGGCGIGIAGGSSNILVDGNEVDGYGNVGYYTDTCNGVAITNNVAGTRPDGSSNPFANQAGCTSGISGNSWQ